MPREFLAKDYVIYPETVRVYRKLLARATPVRVIWIDEYDQPWVYCRFRRRDKTWEVHWLAFNHSGFDLVPRRRAKRS